MKALKIFGILIAVIVVIIVLIGGYLGIIPGYLIYLAQISPKT